MVQTAAPPLVKIIAVVSLNGDGNYDALGGIDKGRSGKHILLAGSPWSSQSDAAL